MREVTLNEWNGHKPFENVKSSSTSSIEFGMNVLIFVDVNESLCKLIPIPLNNLNELDSSLSNMNIPSWSFNNELNMIELNLNRFMNLESIVIGNDCFESVQTFRIDGLNRLRMIKIGKNSFTQVKETGRDEISYTERIKSHNISKSFHILNCKSLESIQIGENSFSDYAGEFELKNLPQLQSIQIGTVGSYSFNFLFCSFMIRGTTIDNEHCNE